MKILWKLLYIYALIYRSTKATISQTEIFSNGIRSSLDICHSSQTTAHDSCSDRIESASCSECLGLSNCCSDPVSTDSLYGTCLDGPETKCPDGGSAICEGSSCPSDITCEYINCHEESQYCWGSTVCDESGGANCANFTGLFCHSHEATSSSFRICCSSALQRAPGSRSALIPHIYSSLEIPQFSEDTDFFTSSPIPDGDGQYTASKLRKYLHFFNAFIMIFY